LILSSQFPDTSFIEAAFAEAVAAGERGEVPIGAVIVKEGQIIARSGNRTITDHDPSAHAEIAAIRQAGAILQSQRLVDCDLYVTLEPCAMCAAAISFARIRRLHFAASDPKGGGVLHGGKFYEQPTCHWKPQVNHGEGSEASAKLLQDFFRARRG